jgi:hypothetical protein
MAGDRKV